jgi:DNA repair protein RadD
MVIKQLNLGFLSTHIGIHNFNRLKNAYEEISLDGHFNGKISDKELALIFFENAIGNDFFEKKQNIFEFYYALPEITQLKINHDLGVDSGKKIKWDEKTSSYFIEQLGINEKFRKRKEKIEAESSEGYLHFEKPNLKFKMLKDYQSSVFFKVEYYLLNTPFARCILQMPTGSGKTRSAMEVVCSIMNQTGKDVLWLANTEELCDQAFDSFKEVWYFLRQQEGAGVNHMRMRSAQEIKKNIPTFHVASLQSLNALDNDKKLIELGIDLNKIELLVVDEAHISIAPTYKKSISNIIQKGSKLLGLTATPGRQLRKKLGDDENHELSEFYFNKRFEIETGDELPIEFLRSRGILSNAKFISVEGSNLENTMSKKEIDNFRLNGDVPKSIEALLTNDNKRTSIIFDTLVQLLEVGKKIIFFGTSIAHSEMISTLLLIKGYNAAHIDGNTGKYRSKIIEDFKNGKLQILCNYGVLSTGFDDPKIDVVFMARKTNSIVLYSQIIGRGLRGPVIGGTDTCEIYTVFDNILDLPANNDIYSYFDEYFINTKDY